MTHIHILNYPEKTNYTQIIQFFFFKILFTYLTERDTVREGTQARGSGRGRSRLPAERRARYGTRSQDPGTMTWAKGSCSTTEPPRRPSSRFLKRYLKKNFFLACSYKQRQIYIGDSVVGNKDNVNFVWLKNIFYENKYKSPKNNKMY